MEKVTRRKTDVINCSQPNTARLCPQELVIGNAMVCYLHWDILPTPNPILWQQMDGFLGCHHTMRTHTQTTGAPRDTVHPDHTTCAPHIQKTHSIQKTNTPASHKRDTHTHTRHTYKRYSAHRDNTQHINNSRHTQKDIHT